MHETYCLGDKEMVVLSPDEFKGAARRERISEILPDYFSSARFNGRGASLFNYEVNLPQGRVVAAAQLEETLHQVPRSFIFPPFKYGEEEYKKWEEILQGKSGVVLSGRYEVHDSPPLLYEEVLGLASRAVLNMLCCGTKTLTLSHVREDEGFPLNLTERTIYAHLKYFSGEKMNAAGQELSTFFKWVKQYVTDVNDISELVHDALRHDERKRQQQRLFSLGKISKVPLEKSTQSIDEYITDANRLLKKLTPPRNKRMEYLAF